MDGVRLSDPRLMKRIIRRAGLYEYRDHHKDNLIAYNIMFEVPPKYQKDIIIAGQRLGLTKEQVLEDIENGRSRFEKQDND